MSKFKPVGVLTKSSTGKTLRLEIHRVDSASGEASEQRYYMYPETVRNVIERRKKIATVYAFFEYTPKTAPKGGAKVSSEKKIIKSSENKQSTLLDFLREATSLMRKKMS